MHRGAQRLPPCRALLQALEQRCKAARVPYFARATLTASKPYTPALKSAWGARKRKAGCGSEEDGDEWSCEGRSGSGSGQGGAAVRLFLAVPAARARLGGSKAFRRHDVW